VYEVEVLVGSGQGKAAAPDFDSLIGPWIESGYRLAVAMLGDPEAAHDALQDSALRAWQSLDHLRDPGMARAWFLSIVANRCRSTIRHRWWSVIRFATRESIAAFPEDSVVQSLDLNRAMSRISPDDRAILQLYFYLDLAVDEIGRVLGISEGAAKTRVYRAARRLRPDLTEEDLQ
jgi:RNA polymerase sigma-70 factor, ECF subfamily